MALSHQQFINKYTGNGPSKSESNVRTYKSLSDEPIHVVHSIILDLIPTTDKEITIMNRLTKPIFEVFENFDYADMKSLLNALIKDEGFEVDKYQLDEYANPLRMSLSNRVWIGEFYVKVKRIGSNIKEEPTACLTPKQIYEQNKTSSVCVGCGQPTTQKALFSSVVCYCPKCCG